MKRPIDDAQIKRTLKTVLLELINEQPEIFLEIFEQAIEERGLVDAIREGRSNKFVNEDTIDSHLAH